MSTELIVVRGCLVRIIGDTLALEELLPDEEGAAVRTIRRQLDQLLERMEKRWKNDRNTG